MSGHMASMLTSEEIGAFNEAAMWDNIEKETIKLGKKILNGRESMRVMAVNRQAVERGMFMLGPDGEMKNLPPHMVISITNPNRRCADVDTANPTLKALLRLQFWDIDDIDAFRGDRRYEEFKKSLFTEFEARKVVNFVRRHAKDVELIICQCEAGQSRSAGLAGAISKAINNDDNEFFRAPYTPNRVVYSKTLRHWKLTADKVCGICKGYECWWNTRDGLQWYPESSVVPPHPR